jgi:hypothetical protein
LPVALKGPLLLVAALPPGCAYREIPLDTAGGAYARIGFEAYLIDASCLNPP